MAMLDEGEFPENTLFCGDAGFVGYESWSAMVSKGHHFLVRARTDSYDRKGSKAARYRPPNPDKKPQGEPKIRLLTTKEKIKLIAINSAKITA